MSEAVEVIIGVANGMVEVAMRENGSGRFAAGAFKPQSAYEFGLKISKAAMEAHRGKPDDKDLVFLNDELAQVRVKVSDVQRDAMIAQAAIIIRSLQDQGKSPGFIAMHVVDSVLQETAR